MHFTFLLPRSPLGSYSVQLLVLLLVKDRSKWAPVTEGLLRMCVQGPPGGFVLGHLLALVAGTTLGLCSFAGCGMDPVGCSLMRWVLWQALIHQIP